MPSNKVNSVAKQCNGKSLGICRINKPASPYFLEHKSFAPLSVQTEDNF